MLDEKYWTERIPRNNLNYKFLIEECIVILDKNKLFIL